MKTKVKAPAALFAATMLALAIMLISDGSVYAQTGNLGNISTEITISPGELFLIDGRASIGAKAGLRCGLGSPVAMGKFGNPGAGGAVGPNIRLELSLGYMPFSRIRLSAGDMFSANENYFGSWTVRNIYPAEPSRPETVASNYFNGTLTSGSISSMRGGATGFDLYGITNQSSQVCGTEGDYNRNASARRYVRLTGSCGNDQEVRFQVSRRPPVDHSGDVYFEESDIFAYGTFRGNITCGQTTDRSRVRTNLTN